MQAKTININSMDDKLAAVTMVKHIMTELSDTATEQEKVIVITKMVLRLFKINANNSP
jgi:hypothetical protein